MASKFAMDRSLESNRFQFPVSENFKCSICLNVLNNPKGCRKNQHYFCFACISQHLAENSHTCPACMDELTAETLVEPPRVLLNCIQELRVKCSYSDRGCPEYVPLGRLQNHVDECGFAPAVCENEGCGAEVNKCEKFRHETELCKFRKIECRGCGELKKEMQELRRNQEKIKAMEEKQKEMDRKMAVMVERVKEGVKDILTGNLHAKVDSILSDTAQASSSHAVQPPFNHDIFIMGGLVDKKITNSVEMFSCKEGRWITVVPMIVPRKAASSVVFDNQIIVSGGLIDVGKEKSESTDSIEILNLNKHPLEWKMSDPKLPVPASFHHTFLFKRNLIVVCHTINKIFQVQFSAPHAAKELCTLPADLDYLYRAELVNEKAFIFGRTSYSRDVLVYDLAANECRSMPALPLTLFNMSTVAWGDQVILLGGRQNVGGAIRFVDADDVVVYDTETGESEILPAMKHTRNGCSAVLADGMIVVMGGHYNSVEYYDFRTNAWKALKAMKMIRHKATAVVSPLPK